MKNLKIIIYIALVLLVSCNRTYLTNGESIYKTGKNLQGEKLLNESNSRIKIVNSCKACHGLKGDRMKSLSIKFRDLSSNNNLETPYTDSLFYRFLDLDLKSDGTKANIGVIWEMNAKDKKDLLDYLKSL